MKSQPQDFGTMPNEIILRIVEHMDTGTRVAFMASKKSLYTLINAHQHSISKNRLATFTLVPSGNVLSSSFSDERHILRNNTFATLHELELRDGRINSLLEALSEMYTKASRPYIPVFSVQDQASLDAILKKALYQCDQIADIAANGSNPPVPQNYYYSILDGIYELPIAFESTSEEVSRLNPLTRPIARRRQIEYIRALPVQDLASLFLMINMFGFGLMRSSKHPSPARFVRKTATEESILRHGTWFLWSRILGDPADMEVAGYIAAAGRAEIRIWESGGAPHMPQGLRMCLSSRLREILGDDDDKLTENIAKVLRRHITGDENAYTAPPGPHAGAE